MSGGGVFVRNVMAVFAGGWFLFNWPRTRITVGSVGPYPPTGSIVRYVTAEHPFIPFWMLTDYHHVSQYSTPEEAREKVLEEEFSGRSSIYEWIYGRKSLKAAIFGEGFK